MPDNDQPKSEEKKDDEKKTEAMKKRLEEMVKREWVVTQHTLSLDGRDLSYHATVGVMPLRNTETDVLEAGMFFTAYTLNGVENLGERPLIFAFNGGPGSASIWLHLGALGPKRARMEDEGWMPAPPYRLVDNPHTWLEFADLVFIDPVGTGFSRAAEPDLNKKFWCLDGDLKSVGEFIRLYLARSGRWESPIYLAGESYGTTRAAGLAGLLADRGIGLSGIVLISMVINFQTLDFEQGNDLPYAMFLPSYAAAAWYHGKLPDDLQGRFLHDLIREVTGYAENEYSAALAKGDNLSADERREVASCVARYTGLSEQYADLADLRINIYRFCKELLRNERRTVGRLDSRFKGIDATPTSEFVDHDPAYSAILPPYTMLMNSYVRRELGFETDLEYEALSMAVNEKWEWERGKFPDTSAKLRDGFTRNPHLRLFVAQGIYDLATPFYAADYSLNHMGLDSSFRGSITRQDYEAGHMFYIETNSLAKFREDVAAFVQG